MSFSFTFISAGCVVLSTLQATSSEVFFWVSGVTVVLAFALPLLVVSLITVNLDRGRRQKRHSIQILDFSFVKLDQRSAIVLLCPIF